MSGKLAWTLGIVLAVLGLAMFAFGFLSRDASKLIEATDAVPGSIPSRSTNDEMAKDRREVVAELTSHQAAIRSRVGMDESAIVNAKFRMAGRDFASVVWPQEKLVLEQALAEVTLKPTRWNLRGEVETRNIPSDVDKFSAFEELLARDQAFMANNHRLGRLAATAIHEFIMASVREANALALESGSKPVFEIVRFDFSGEFAKFQETGSPDAYGEPDPYLRRNFMVEMIADPRLSDRINRAFFSRPAQPPFLRVVRSSTLPNDTPVSITKTIKPEEVRLFFRHSTFGRALLNRLVLGGGRESWQDVLTKDDASFAEWLKVGANLDALRVLMDADPAYHREPIPARSKLWLQMLENKPIAESPLAAPMTKASEGLPPAESGNAGT